MLPPEFRFIERGWFNGNNILLLGDKGPVIVDTGHLLYVEETLALIRAAGVEPADLQQIVITHGHADHHGGNRRLKELSGATIGMGPITAGWFADQRHLLLWSDHLGQEMDIVPADVVYEPETEITLAGMPFQVVAIPGHAPDAVAYFQPDSKVVICADAMWPDGDLGVLNTAVHGPNVLEGAELAVQRLKALPAEIALPGHGGIITDVAENLAAVEAKLARFRAEPVQMVKHIVRRFSMFCILRFQPLEREALVQIAIQGPWLRDYTQLWQPDWSAEQMFNYVLDQFIERGLVYEEAGVLKCRVPV